MASQLPSGLGLPGANYEWFQSNKPSTCARNTWSHRTSSSGLNTKRFAATSSTTFFLAVLKLSLRQTAAQRRRLSLFCAVANSAVGAVAVADMKTYRTVQPSEPVERRFQFCKPAILLVRRRLGVLLTRAIATRAEVAAAEARSRSLRGGSALDKRILNSIGICLDTNSGFGQIWLESVGSIARNPLCCGTIRCR